MQFFICSILSFIAKYAPKTAQAQHKAVTYVCRGINSGRMSSRAEKTNMPLKDFEVSGSGTFLSSAFFALRMRITLKMIVHIYAMPDAMQIIISMFIFL